MVRHPRNKWKYIYMKRRFPSMPKRENPEFSEKVDIWGDGVYEFLDNDGYKVDSIKVYYMDFRARADSKGRPMYKVNSGKYAHLSSYNKGYNAGFQDGQKGIKVIHGEDDSEYNMGYIEGYGIGFTKGYNKAAREAEPIILGKIGNIEVEDEEDYEEE